MEIPAAVVKNGEQRAFGFKLGGSLALIGGLFWWREQVILPVIFWSISVILILAALVIPRRLRAVERGWMRTGEWVGRFTTPVIMALVFFGVLTPAGVLLRVFGANPIKARRPTLWIRRQDGGRSNLKKQF